MAGTLFRIGVVQVFIGAEDHPPPHVHAFHVGEGWRARFRFSFLSDVAGLYRFRRRGRRPTETTLNAVLKVTLTLADGQQLTLTAGQHIEEADEW